MSYGGAAEAPASEIGEGVAWAAPPIDGHIAGAGSCSTISNRFGSASASSRGTRQYSAAAGSSAMSGRASSPRTVSPSSDKTSSRAGGMATGRIYRGVRSPSGCRVYVLGPDGAAPLTPRSGCARSSLSWGTRGAGAQDLAWAVIRDATGDCRLADDWCADLGGRARQPASHGRVSAGGRQHRGLAGREPGRPSEHEALLVTASRQPAGLPGGPGVTALDLPTLWWPVTQSLSWTTSHAITHIAISSAYLPIAVCDFRSANARLA
jgi:hypothetical protein